MYMICGYKFDIRHIIKHFFNTLMQGKSRFDANKIYIFIRVVFLW